MAQFNFENSGEEYFARRGGTQGTSALVRLVFKLSGGKINTTEGANACLLAVAIIFFILSGVVLWYGL